MSENIQIALKPESEIDKQEAKTLKEALTQNTKDKISL